MDAKINKQDFWTLQHLVYEGSFHFLQKLKDHQKFFIIYQPSSNKIFKYTSTNDFMCLSTLNSLKATKRAFLETS